MPFITTITGLFLFIFMLPLPAPLAAAPNVQELAIFFTNDVGGQTEPCG